MHKETELLHSPRSISEFSDLVPNPTQETEELLFHIDNLAGIVGISSMRDTIAPYLYYEHRNIHTRHQRFDPETSLLVVDKRISGRNAHSISQQLLSGMIVHYGLIHNERFSVPSPEPQHYDTLPPYQSIAWDNGSYIFSRVRKKEVYEKSVGLFLNGLEITLPKTTEGSIFEAIEAIRQGL